MGDKINFAQGATLSSATRLYAKDFPLTDFEEGIIMPLSKAEEGALINQDQEPDIVFHINNVRA